MKLEPSSKLTLLWLENHHSKSKVCLQIVVFPLSCKFSGVVFFWLVEDGNLLITCDESRPTASPSTWMKIPSWLPVFNNHSSSPPLLQMGFTSTYHFTYYQHPSSNSPNLCKMTNPRLHLIYTVSKFKSESPWKPWCFSGAYSLWNTSVV